MKNKTGLLSNSIIWFGVAISVSEIEAGIQIATHATASSIWIPLILGHIIGALLLFLVGYIGSQVRLNAMQTTSSTFGIIGSKFFASLNVLQLIAWIAVLNAQGALAVSGLNISLSYPITCIILAFFVAIWVYIGLERSSKITTVVMSILTILLIILTLKLLKINMLNFTGAKIDYDSILGFWNIFEVSIAMPISWLPVISDYTKDVKKPFEATAISSLAYTIASLWMYFIGIEIASIQTSNVAQAIITAGLGTVGIIIMVLSTVTTNFLATNSAGESAKAIYNKIDPKIAGFIVSILSALLAISGIMNNYINFLYLISSVFAPMAAVQLVSYYLRKDVYSSCKINIWNIFSWFSGFIIYQIVSSLNNVLLGPTLLAVIVSAIFCYLGIIINKKNIIHF